MQKVYDFARRNPWAVAVIVAVLAALGITIAVTDDNGDGKPDHVTITVKNAQGDPVKVEATQHQLDNVEGSDAGHHQDLGDESAASPRDLTRDDQAASPQAPRIVGQPPLASANQAGCLTRQIGTNYSARVGIRPSLIVLHYTVSPNVVGWNDVNAIVAFFNRSATQASSNYVIDNEGHCVLMVPEALKAWAQAGFNSATACSIEVVNTGSEATYIGPPGGPGERQLARVVHDCAARWHIPLRRGAVSGCAVTSSGVVDHDTLGSCGGGHVDIGKYRPGAIYRTIKLARSGGLAPIPAVQRRHCKEAHRLRTDGKKSPGQTRRLAVLKAGFAKHGLSCAGGKVKRR